MPRIDPREFINDREKYPDDMEITLANGDIISAKEYRDALMPKADFTRATEGWKRREQELQNGYDAAQQQLMAAMQEKQQWEASRGQPAPPARSGGISPEELEADPILGPLYRDMKASQQRLDAHEKRMSQHETTFMRGQFMSKITALKDQDKDLDVNEFLTYSQKNPVIDVENQMVDLDRTYKLYAHDRLLTNARKAGEEAGIEKGRKSANVPKVPFGRRSSPTKPEGLPDSLQNLKDEDVMNDPEMQEAERGDQG